ncbi:MAG: hypothetical protein K9H64_03260 [Bacteroidales bacterium]|nr:hypothetical protein [Bacteroidales bacterium]MCF8454439.1 hypothetical protein [Bacteroidales bacterium]
MKYFHSHIILPEKCKGHIKCIKSCPTEALRYRNNKITFFDDLCVDCGACLNICPEKVFVPVMDEVSDFEKYLYKVAIPSRILYSQFSSDIHPKLIHEALIKTGFDEVADISLNINELGFAISEHIKTKKDGKPIISSFCPAVLRLIQVNYPNLIDLISPFDVPREITAKEAKRRISVEKGIDINKIGAIYISPCPAKVVSIKQPAEKEKSWIDGAVAISDIYKVLLPEISRLRTNRKQEDYTDYFYFGRGWGLLSQVLSNIDSEKCMSVIGIENIKMILDDIEDSKLVNVDYLEAFTCTQACVGGAFCVENPYIARHNAFLLEKKYCVPTQFDQKEVGVKYKTGFYFMENRVYPRATRTLSTDLSTSIKRMKQKERIISKLPKKDCGLCGAPTCETFAEDCTRGEADLSDCYFFHTSPHH